MREALSNDFFTIISLSQSSSFLKFHELENGFAYFKKYRLNLNTGIKEKYPIKKFLEALEKITFKSEFENPRVIHLFYELGYIINCKKLVKDDDILAIDLMYLKVYPYFLKIPPGNFMLKSKKSISFLDYKKKFLEGKKQLLNGNCYQLNITFPFEFFLEKEVIFDNFIGKIWEKKKNRGAYAHASSIPILNRIFVSNSPECLFQIKKNKSSLDLWSMPIKGTLKIGNKKNYKKEWENLKKCPKNQAELFMISDLIKNDLSKIEKPTAKVVFKKKSLRLPNILHQFSLISVRLSKEVNLAKIILNLFPGGSVTGAPKRRSMEILYKIESQIPRAFYCGSTIILHKSLLAGSINIRSATIDTKTKRFVYGSGGGITLPSLPREEFGEMNLKFESFLKTLIN